jgi:spermidine/putrescine transport system substrate-binding protein/spermidine/putrescine transport system permease protein
MKKFVLLLLCITFAATLSACGPSASKGKLTVLNYGKYIDPDVLDAFEKKTGIKVEYEEYQNPEEMYTKYKAGSIDYDLICTSDYMIQKLIGENQVLKLDYSKIPNFKNIDSTYMDFSKAFDPNSQYTIPYFFGTVGILYDSKKVDESEVNSWNVLWNEKYKKQIVMEDSVRDSFMVPLKKLGYSLNTTDQNQLNEALNLLIQQKTLVYSYLVDQAGDEMAAGNATLALVYSGEAAYAQSQNSDLKFVVPKEGSNMWIDSWFMPKTCKNTENANKFLDFLCQEDNAMKNFKFVDYATPNKAVFDALDKKEQDDKTIFPTQDTLKNCEVLSSLDQTTTNLYNDLWKKLKSN